MKIAAGFILLSAMLSSGLNVQTTDCCFTRPFPQKVRLSARLSEKLLIHKEPTACLNIAVVGEVKGTVVLVMEINKNGDVLHPAVVSGPALLRKTVLDAVRKYKYKPYLLNGEPVEVETTVAVQSDTLRACPAE